MKKPRCIYSIDWLQLYCSNFLSNYNGEEVRTSPMTDKWGNHREYRFKQPNEFIKGYVYNKSVWYRKYEVAIVAWQPKDHNHDSHGCAIKLKNAVLYIADWHFILADVLASLGWRALSITRIDLACDLNFFIGGLSPETFIRKYMLKGDSSYVREGSNKWACYGQKELHRNNFESIRWGSRQSGVSVYLYNKSKELGITTKGETTHKYKPWIVDAWRSQSLDTSKVWRVEISINSAGRGLKDVSNAFLRSLFVDELSCQQGIENTFKVYAKRYFAFRKVERNGPKRKKDMKQVALLDYSDTPLLKPSTLYSSTKSMRKEKIVLRELEELTAELEYDDMFANLPLINALDLVSEIYAQRSVLAHRCETMGNSITDCINKKVEEHLSTEGLYSRFQQSKNIASDGDYIADVAKRIAKRAQEYILRNGATQPANVPLPSTPLEEGNVSNRNYLK